MNLTEGAGAEVILGEVFSVGVGVEGVEELATCSFRCSVRSSGEGKVLSHLSHMQETFVADDEREEERGAEDAADDDAVEEGVDVEGREREEGRRGNEGIDTQLLEGVDAAAAAAARNAW